ncbi:unnamed protein product, partial [Rotaria sp. Silwood1]
LIKPNANNLALIKPNATNALALMLTVNTNANATPLDTCQEV